VVELRGPGGGDQTGEHIRAVLVELGEPSGLGEADLRAVKRFQTDRWVIFATGESNESPNGDR
jgi:hypothetical protein